jgi:uncharacterized protein (TIGR03067 family)
MVRWPLLVLTLALAPLASRGEDDPEPPGGSAELRKLKGTWTVSRRIIGGKESKPPRQITYTFEGDKLTLDSGLGKKQTSKVKIDTKKRPFAIELTLEGTNTVRVGIYKIEKGELFLALVSAKAPKPPTTFDGTTGSVMVLTQDKK